MNLEFLGKQRMRAISIALLALFAFSLLVSPVMAGTEEEELHELGRNEFDYMAVCDFINARIYEVESRIEDNEENLPFDESMTFDPILKYKDKFISADYIVLKFSNVLTASIEHLVIDAPYIKDIDRSHILFRLGISKNIKSDNMLIWCENTYMKLKFNRKELININLEIVSVD